MAFCSTHPPNKLLVHSVISWQDILAPPYKVPFDYSNTNADALEGSTGAFMPANQWFESNWYPMHPLHLQQIYLLVP